MDEVISRSVTAKAREAERKQEMKVKEAVERKAKQYTNKVFVITLDQVPHATRITSRVVLLKNIGKCLCFQLSSGVSAGLFCQGSKFSFMSVNR